MPKLGSLCFFNNKGGVGKTTLACNVASFLAETENLNVLIVDADPQCNATQLVLPDDLTEALYTQEDSALSIGSLKQVLSPLLRGDATLEQGHRIASPETNRFGISVLPGHPQIALLEDRLSTQWSSFLSGDLGGARVSNWNTQLLRQIGDDYDLIIYDVGPSLGALNRSVLLGVDYFLAPMGCDIFSLIGIENIANWIAKWRTDYDQSFERVRSAHAGLLKDYADQIRKNSETMSLFVGYTVQQYITKTISKQKRPTSAYEAILKKIPAEIDDSLRRFTAPSLSIDDVRLGDVPHMFSLVPLAQTNHTPIHKLTRNDGLSGGQFSQQEAYNKFILELTQSLLRNLRRNASETND